MDKQSIERKLSQSVKGAMLVSSLQVEKFIGCGTSKTKRLLEGLEAVELDGRKKFYVPDVAQRIMERSVIT